MTTPTRVRKLSNSKGQGVALPIILMLLIVITMMGVSTVKTGNFQASMANNSRAVQIVDQTAETAIESVLQSVLGDTDCISFNKMMKQVKTDEIEAGGLTSTSDDNGGNSNAIDDSGGVGLDITGASSGSCVGNSWLNLADRGIEARTDSRFCGPVSGVAGFEMGSFVNLKFETRGLARMVSNKTDIQNVQFWVQLGVDSNDMQPAQKDCTGSVL